MNLPVPMSMWEYVGAGRQRSTFYLVALVSEEEVVAVQYRGECMFIRAPIPPDFSWGGTVTEFYAHFRLARAPN